MKKTTILLIALMVISVGFLSGCNQQSTEIEDDFDIHEITGYDVEYRVSGILDDGVSVTYANRQGGTEQREVPESFLPWTRSLWGMMKGDFVYISAQANGWCASLTVEIYLEGVEVRSSTSHGDYCIATASGTI